MILRRGALELEFFPYPHLDPRDTTAHLTGRPAVGLPGIRGRRPRRQPAPLPGAARHAASGRTVSGPLTQRPNRCVRVPPNKRLKLPGALVLKEAVVLCAGGHGLSFTSLAPAGGSPAA